MCLFFTFITGTIYGISLGIYYLFEKKINLLKLLFFIISSSIAYYAAIYATILSFIPTINTDWSHPQPTPALQFLNPLCLFVGGITGALLLVLGILFFIEKISLQKGIMIVIAGGILGMTFDLVPLRSGVYTTYQNILVLFICWQVGMNLLLNFLPNKYK